MITNKNIEFFKTGNEHDQTVTISAKVTVGPQYFTCDAEDFQKYEEQFKSRARKEIFEAAYGELRRKFKQIETPILRSSEFQYPRPAEQLKEFRDLLFGGE